MIFIKIYGSPNLNKKTNKFYFTPKKNIGSKYPKNENIQCFGKDLRSEKVLNEINLNYIIDAYNSSTNKTSFFNSYFIKLSGNDNLKNNMKKKDVGEVKKAIMNLEKKSEEFIEKRMNSSLDEIIKGKKIEDIDNA